MKDILFLQKFVALPIGILFVIFSIAVLRRASERRSPLRSGVIGGWLSGCLFLSYFFVDLFFINVSSTGAIAFLFLPGLVILVTLISFLFFWLLFSAYYKIRP